jgi:hypothetical protein
VPLALAPRQNHFLLTVAGLPRGRLHRQAFVPHENRVVFERRGGCIVLLGMRTRPTPSLPSARRLTLRPCSPTELLE